MARNSRRSRPCCEKCKKAVKPSAIRSSTYTIVDPTISVKPLAKETRRLDPGNPRLWPKVIGFQTLKLSHGFTKPVPSLGEKRKEQAALIFDSLLEP